MPWLPMYLESADSSLLLKYLNEDEEIAYLIGEGPGRWKAVKTLANLADETYSLWHIPGPPLPLLGAKYTDKDDLVPDPWKGWTERRAGDNSKRPYFGAGHISNPRLNVRVKHVPFRPDPRGTNFIGMSSFEWIGNHYRMTGAPTSLSTEAWWKRLRKWVAKQAVKIPRAGELDGPGGEIWAFSAALEAIRSGRPRASNPL